MTSTAGVSGDADRESIIVSVIMYAKIVKRMLMLKNHSKQKERKSNWKYLVISHLSYNYNSAGS